MLQNSRVSAVEASATYRLQPRLRQSAILLVRMLKLVKKSLPKNSGGGSVKMASRLCVA